MNIKDFINEVGVAQAALTFKCSEAAAKHYRNGIRNVRAQNVIPICKATNWRVTPHELRPDIYPNPSDGTPPTATIRTGSGARFTPHTGGGHMYSTDSVDRREKDRREAERRESERRNSERRTDSAQAASPLATK